MKETFKITPSKGYRGRLSPKDAAVGIAIAKENAVDLLQDAILLLENERFPRASSLAILVIEESGKAKIFRSLILEDDPKEIKKLWQELVSHRKKNNLWLLPKVVEKGGQKLEDIRFLIEDGSGHTLALDILKQLGFYSGINDKKEWLNPKEIIPRELAQEHIDTARSLCKNENSVEWTEELLSIWVENLKLVIKSDFSSMKTGLVQFYREAVDKGLVDQIHLEVINRVVS
jgi:AbiV family abortive infection protein